MKPIVAWQMTLETAEEFYIRCAERKAVSVKERVKILKEIAKEYGLVGLNEEDVNRRIKGRNVLRFKPSDKTNKNI